eukprot:scaffold103683_cov36-Phaeocystis_antarctica.AAC.1
MGLGLGGGRLAPGPRRGRHPPRARAAVAYASHTPAVCARHVRGMGIGQGHGMHVASTQGVYVHVCSMSAADASRAPCTSYHGYSYYGHTYYGYAHLAGDHLGRGGGRGRESSPSNLVRDLNLAIVIKAH